MQWGLGKVGFPLGIRSNGDWVEVRRGKQRGQEGIIEQVSSLSPPSPLSSLSLPIPNAQIGIS
ncbi:KOW motif-containing protein [Nostoc sp. DedSLP04]|uniref:KOW motif-containing protein n=1 Tax=Nostoc sp. DedSLP04 TaxID=3075401 RepID=UPI003A100CDA